MRLFEIQSGNSQDVQRPLPELFCAVDRAKYQGDEGDENAGSEAFGRVFEFNVVGAGGERDGHEEVERGFGLDGFAINFCHPTVVVREGEEEAAVFAGFHSADEV